MAEVSRHARGVDHIQQAELRDQRVQLEQQRERLADTARSTDVGDLWRKVRVDEMQPRRWVQMDRVG